MRSMVHRKYSVACALALAGVVAAEPALAAVKREGAWPEQDRRVSLDVSRVPRDEAIKRLAEAAGWSVVVHAPQADPVDVHVKDQPAGKVLDLLLLDADYVATRDGTLVSIRRVTGEAPAADRPAAGAPKKGDAKKDDRDGDDRDEDADDDRKKDDATKAEPPAPPRERGRDRDVMGESLKIGKDEVVNDVSVMGGSLDVYGTVTGDIDVAGGKVRIHPGAHVHGDVSAMGGDVRVEDGGRVDGEIEVVGGVVRRGDKAILGGGVHGRAASHAEKGGGEGDGPAVVAATGEKTAREARGAAGKVGRAFARMALLFVFGTVLLALTPERMDALKAELVARPMRSFAMGVLGVLGAGVAFVLLCATVIGIPFALVGALLAVLAVIASMCAVLETVGRALTRHRTANPYVHLAVGCGLFLGVGALPVVGPLAVLVVVLLAAGALVSTRGAGLVKRRLAGAQPYRAAAV